MYLIIIVVNYSMKWHRFCYVFVATVTITTDLSNLLQQSTICIVAVIDLVRYPIHGTVYTELLFFMIWWIMHRIHVFSNLHLTIQVKITRSRFYDILCTMLVFVYISLFFTTIPYYLPQQLITESRILKSEEKKNACSILMKMYLYLL